MTQYAMDNDAYQLVYDVLSFSLASMMATTVFLFMRVPSVLDKYRTALIISGLVTFIAAYHYIRIFNSWVEAYEYPKAENTHFCWPAPLPPPAIAEYPSPLMTGVPFNDAYRYMDWLLTVPLLLMEIVLVMSLPAEESSSKCQTLGLGSALMIISGYKGELVVQGNLSARWGSWCLSMCFFLWIVYTLLVGLSAATESEKDPAVKAKIKTAQWWTVISWCTYPIVYLFPMLQIGGAAAVVLIQVGYCISDIISKCGVGLVVYQITIMKSRNEGGGQ
jgi:hypothetical protein